MSIIITRGYSWGSTELVTNTKLHTLIDSATVDMSAPSAIGGTTPSTGAFTTLTATGNIYTAAWADYSTTSTIVGWAATPSAKIYTKKIGKTVFVSYLITGTSNATGASFTVPYTSSNTVDTMVCNRPINNGTETNIPGLTILGKNVTLVTLYLEIDDESYSWTASGTKTVWGQFFYEAD